MTRAARISSFALTTLEVFRTAATKNVVLSMLIKDKIPGASLAKKTVNHNGILREKTEISTTLNKSDSNLKTVGR